MEIDDNQRQCQSACVSPSGFPGIHHSYWGGERLPHSCRAPRGSHGSQQVGQAGKEGGLLENDCHPTKRVDLWTSHWVYILTTRESAGMEGEKGARHKPEENK